MNIQWAQYWDKPIVETAHGQKARSVADVWVETKQGRLVAYNLDKREGICSQGKQWYKVVYPLDLADGNTSVCECLLDPEPIEEKFCKWVEGIKTTDTQYWPLMKNFIFYKPTIHLEPFKGGFWLEGPEGENGEPNLIPEVAKLYKYCQTKSEVQSAFLQALKMLYKYPEPATWVKLKKTIQIKLPEKYTVAKAPSGEYGVNFKKLKLENYPPDYVPAANNVLQIDIDSEEDYKIFKQNLSRFFEDLKAVDLVGILGYQVKPSKTPGCKHITIYLDRELDIKDRLILQLVFGSDRIRELRSWGRVNKSLPDPIIFTVEKHSGIPQKIKYKIFGTQNGKIPEIESRFTNKPFGSSKGLLCTNLHMHHPGQTPANYHLMYHEVNDPTPAEYTGKSFCEQCVQELKLTRYNLNYAMPTYSGESL